MILPAYKSISAALLTASLPTLSPASVFFWFSPPLLLRTQGQLSYILMMNSPSRPQSLCHYKLIARGPLGPQSEDTTSQPVGGCGSTKHAAVLHLPTCSHHPTKPPPSQQASVTLENFVPCQHRPLIKPSIHCWVISGLEGSQRAICFGVFLFVCF